MLVRPLIHFFAVYICLSFSVAQEHSKNLVVYSGLKKRVYSFTKVDFITAEGEFNETICTLVIPDLLEDSPPFVSIYYKIILRVSYIKIEKKLLCQITIHIAQNITTM